MQHKKMLYLLYSFRQHIVNIFSVNKSDRQYEPTDSKRCLFILAKQETFPYNRIQTVLKGGSCHAESDEEEGFFYSLLIILILLAGYILLRIENHSLQSKEEAQLQLKMDAVSEVRLCRLLYSLCRYVVIIAAVYYVFEYLGINLATYFAGVGMLSLAISMGSRDMVADIMSGIMILFEHQFQVGDYVELDNTRGKVLEMGIRSTKLLTGNNDIMYISNSYIRTVINKSKNASPCVTDLIIVSEDPIEAVENRFKKALKEIGMKNKKIVGDLSLVGITRVTGGGANNQGKTISMRIRCECKERDYDDVRDFINRELYLYCERENIEIK